MAKTKDEIIDDIEFHVGHHNSEDSSEEFPNWYVGITANPDERLFNDHKVKKVKRTIER